MSDGHRNIRQQREDPASTPDISVCNFSPFERTAVVKASKYRRLWVNLQANNGISSTRCPVQSAVDVFLQVRVNVPSWCDRILWKSYPETHVTCTAYGKIDMNMIHMRLFLLKYVFFPTIAFNCSSSVSATSRYVNKVKIINVLLLKIRAQLK